MHTMPAGLRPFKITDPLPHCGTWKERMPSVRDQEVYDRYIKARKFWRSRIEFEFTRADLQHILNDVRWAADKGDWGAIALLSHFYLHGLGPFDYNNVLTSDPDSSISLVRRAVAAGQAWGYYDLGVAHEYGYGGAALDDAIAWAYFLKAAELGSPDAQMALAEAYGEARRPEDERTMLMCAFRQGHGAAAERLGLLAEVHDKFDEAVSYYQEGTKLGNAASASALMLTFDPEFWGNNKQETKDKLRRLQIYPDPERGKRYKELADALKINPDLRLGQLDQVLPLPPAELPEWHGIEAAITPEPPGPHTY